MHCNIAFECPAGRACASSVGEQPTIHRISQFGFHHPLLGELLRMRAVRAKGQENSRQLAVFCLDHTTSLLIYGALQLDDSYLLPPVLCPLRRPGSTNLPTFPGPISLSNG